jgi:hypothetical protein
MGTGWKGNGRGKRRQVSNKVIFVLILLSSSVIKSGSGLIFAGILPKGGYVPETRATLPLKSGHDSASMVRADILRNSGGA